MIEDGSDKPGHSLRALVWSSLSTYETDKLFQFLNDKDSIVRSIAARELQLRGTRRVFHRASKMTGDPSDITRELGAFILGQIGTPRRPFRGQSIPVLCMLAKNDPSANVRSTAVAALGHLRANEQAGLIVELANDPDYRVRTCAAAATIFLEPSDAILKCLVKLAGDDDRRVKRWAAYALDYLQNRVKAKTKRLRRN